MNDPCAQPIDVNLSVTTPPPGLDAALLGHFSHALRVVADSGRAVLLDYASAGDAALRPAGCRTGRMTVAAAAHGQAASDNAPPRRVTVEAPGPFTVRIIEVRSTSMIAETWAGAQGCAHGDTRAHGGGGNAGGGALPGAPSGNPPPPLPLRLTEAQGAALRGCKAVLGYLLGPECHCGAPGCAVPRVPLGRVFGAGPVPDVVPGAASEAPRANARAPGNARGADCDPEAFAAWAALWLPAAELLRRMPGREGTGAKPSGYAVTGRAFALVAALYGWGLDNRGQCVRLVRG